MERAVGELVAALRVDSFSLFELKLKTSCQHLNCLMASTFEVHLDSGFDRIPTYEVTERIQIKIRT